MTNSNKLRLDQLLLKKKLVSSRERAKSLILAGKVRIGDEVADKPGRMCDEECPVLIIKDIHPYVSRGGLKLEHALKEFNISVVGKVAVDIGASTGGFTDCLIQHGINKVFALDVGYGQLDWKLQSDPRVLALDRKNARDFVPNDIEGPVDLIVIDVSFISLKLVIPSAISALKPEGELVALVKPQFEVGKDQVENKGIIKDSKKHLNVLFKLRSFMKIQGWPLINLTASPITGQKGNREYLIYCCANRGHGTIDEEYIRNKIKQ